MKNRLKLGLAAVSLAALMVAAPIHAGAQQLDPAIKIGAADLGGVVKSAKGPEAGVWVIAETSDLPTKFAKMVVTDDKGRYVLPELPKANYKVWVRGYGLIDSAKVDAAPGKVLDLTAVLAPDEKSAADYYPAIFWFAMLGIPKASEFPGTGPQGNGMSTGVKDQGQWLDVIKTDGCYTCHQIGNKATRDIEPMFKAEYKTSAEAWERRIQSGQAMEFMTRMISKIDPQTAFKHFGDWSNRIAAGELPFDKPQRPQGLERNVVISMWDWSRPYTYLHDQIATDKRNPSVNANGPIYGSAEESTDYVPVLDPVLAKASEFKMPVRDADTPTTKDNMANTSPYWGDEKVWDSQANMHNPMIDSKGRVWFTSRVGPPDNPAFCLKGSDHPSAKAFPLEKSNRHLAMYEPKTGKTTLVRTCFSTHHLNFSLDGTDTIWTSGGGPQNDAVGWFNVKVFEEAGDEAKAQGWTPIVLDTVGDGVRHDYVEPNRPLIPGKDKRISAGLYGVSVNPKDGTVWGSTLGFPGGILRIDPGKDPTQTALAEYYEVPWKDPKAPVNGYSPRGFDIDANGVAWVPLASGHLASFDRAKCKGQLNGLNATGRHCPEGWTLFPFPGPQFRDVTDSGSAEASYYTWVDLHDVFGLGANTPFATGNANDSIMAFKDGKFINMRVPYPMGFYAKGMDARIDDPKAGWKGRGLWSTTGNRTPQHLEGGKGTLSKVVKFQMRPDPLAN